MDPYYLEVRSVFTLSCATAFLQMCSLTVVLLNATAPFQAVFDSLREAAGEHREGFGEVSNVEKHSHEEIEKFTIDEARFESRAGG